MRPRVLGFVGWSGSGKTTLLTAVITELAAQGLQIATIKHAHHTFDIDHPGKDSHRHRQAGAAQVLVTSRDRWALMHELRGAPEPSPRELLARLDPADLVLIEGFKTHPHRKIEVHRPSLGKALLQPADPMIIAVASDAALQLTVPVLPLADVTAIARFVWEEARALD